jgi:hypothetical protein
MKQLTASASVATLMLISGQVVARQNEVNGPVPMPPVRVWTQAAPLGEASADPHFVQIMKWDINSLDAWTKTSGQQDRTGSSMANKFIDMIRKRPFPASARPVAIMPVRVSLGNIRTPAGAPGPMRFPALLAHEADQLEPGYTDPLSNRRTPWKTNGIAEATAWMNLFLATLQSASNSTDPLVHIPTPERFLFDDEPNDVFSEETNVGTSPWLNFQQTNMPTVVSYWTKIFNDDRFLNEPVPGFDGKTLSELWQAANVTGPVVESTWDWRYIGGSQSNEKWANWYRNVMAQAEAGAMQAAFYDRIHFYFPNAMCSDYDRSMRLDGLNGGSNSWFGGDNAGAMGTRRAWDGKGDLQAPCLYPGAGPDFYHTNLYKPTIYNPSTNPYPWAFVRTNDQSNVESWCPYEPIGLMSSRTHRFVLDGICRSFAGAYRGSVVGGVFKSRLAPWVPLPGQAFTLRGVSPQFTCVSPTYTMPGEFAEGLYHVASCADIRRTLAQIKSRGSSEFNVWNNPVFGLDSTTAAMYPTINANVHSQHEYNWSRLAELVDQVWGFNVSSSQVTCGAITGNSSGPIHPLAYAFNDPLTVTSAATPLNGWRTIVDTTFSNAYSPLHGDPTYLRVSVELTCTAKTELQIALFNFAANTWVAFDESPSISGVQNPIVPFPTYANNGTSTLPPATRRISARFPVSSVNFGNSGKVVVRLATKQAPVNPQTPIVPVTYQVQHDLVQVTADDNDDFATADFNTDGVVNCQDRDLFNLMHFAASLAGAKDLMKSAADFDRNGVVNSDDYAAFLAAWESAGGSCP